MDSTVVRSKSDRSRHAANKERRLRTDKRDNYPNGYLESWDTPISSKPISSHSKPVGTPARPPTPTPSPASIPPEIPHPEEKGSNFNAVSIIVSVQNNLLLNKENNYQVRFSTGVLEGSGISINEAGSVITFDEEGSYRFELCGEATLFSDVDVTLVYDSDKFSPEIIAFSRTKVPKLETTLQLRGIPTILPIQKGQTIVTRLLPTPDESIMLIAGARLLIHRVA
jgi:hypothetical protein